MPTSACLGCARRRAIPNACRDGPVTGASRLDRFFDSCCFPPCGLIAIRLAYAGQSRSPLSRTLRSPRLQRAAPCHAVFPDESPDLTSTTAGAGCFECDSTPVTLESGRDPDSTDIDQGKIPRTNREPDRFQTSDSMSQFCNSRMAVSVLFLIQEIINKSMDSSMKSKLNACSVDQFNQ